MKKSHYIIIYILVSFLIFVSCYIIKCSLLNKAPEKAKLVIKNFTYKTIDIKDDNMIAKNYYKQSKNYINMEQESENEIRSDIDEKIYKNIIKKHD